MAFSLLLSVSLCLESPFKYSPPPPHPLCRCLWSLTVWQYVCYTDFGSKFKITVKHGCKFFLLLYIFSLCLQPKKARYEAPLKKPPSHPSPVKPSPLTGKFYPKSLSIKDILSLRQVVENKAKKILIYKFDFVHME